LNLRQAGSILHSRYRVVRNLGQGAMGAVYLAEDLLLSHTLWAVKEIDLSAVPLHEHALAQALFQRECDTLAKLIHPGIPRAIDFFRSDDGNMGLVMQWLEGHPLDEVLNSLSRALWPSEALPIALQITHVLEYLHGRTPPIIYRDLKPSNLIVTRLGRVYFIDFGIARQFQAGQAKDTQEFGTPGFCAPEQYGHGQTTARSDVYAVGTTLFQLLTQGDPQSYNFTFPPLSTFFTPPDGLQDVMDKCLQIKPEDRYGDVVALRHDLEKVWADVKAPAAGATQALGLAYLAQHPKEYVDSPARQSLHWKSYVKTMLSPFRPKP
jgi:serine/threonine protein kinase